jgi:hypothetical protein
MLVAGFHPETDTDDQGPAHQRLGRGETVGALQEPGQVVEVESEVGVVGAEGTLVDGESAAHEGSVSATRLVASLRMQETAPRRRLSWYRTSPFLLTA